MNGKWDEKKIVNRKKEREDATSVICFFVR